MQNFHIKCSSLLFSTIKYKMITIKLAIKGAKFKKFANQYSSEQSLVQKSIKKKSSQFCNRLHKIWANKCIINAKQDCFINMFFSLVWTRCQTYCSLFGSSCFPLSSWSTLCNKKIIDNKTLATGHFLRVTTSSIEYYSVKNKALRRSRHSKRLPNISPTTKDKNIFIDRKTLIRNVRLSFLKDHKLQTMYMNFLKSSWLVALLQCKNPNSRRPVGKTTPQKRFCYLKYESAINPLTDIIFTIRDKNAQ